MDCSHCEPFVTCEVTVTWPGFNVFHRIATASIPTLAVQIPINLTATTTGQPLNIGTISCTLGGASDKGQCVENNSVCTEAKSCLAVPDVTYTPPTNMPNVALKLKAAGNGLQPGCGDYSASLYTLDPLPGVVSSVIVRAQCSKCDAAAPAHGVD